MDTRAAAPCGIWLLVPDTLSMLGEHAEAPVHDPEETQGVTTPSISMPFGRMQCSAAAHHRSLGDLTTRRTSLAKLFLGPGVPPEEEAGRDLLRQQTLRGRC